MVREEEAGRSETHKVATSTASCCCIPTGVFRPFTSTCSRSNIDPPQRNVNDATSDQPTREGQGVSQAPTRVYFPTTVDGSMT
jgi:hypothetical protein